MEEGVTISYHGSVTRTSVGLGQNRTTTSYPDQFDSTIGYDRRGRTRLLTGFSGMRCVAEYNRRQFISCVAAGGDANKRHHYKEICGRCIDRSFPTELWVFHRLDAHYNIGQQRVCTVFEWISYVTPICPEI